jgi:TldD protein
MNRLFRIFVFMWFVLLALSVGFAAEAPPDILGVMQTELNRSMTNLAGASEVPMYYLQYEVTEERNYNLSASNGAFESPRSSFRRYLDVDVRVGSMALDNTHQIRGGGWQDNYSPRRQVDFPVEGNPEAIRAALWAETEYQYRMAQERYTKVLTNRQVKVQEEDLSDDFSAEPPEKFTEESKTTPIDTTYWRGVMRKVAEYFTGFPFVYNSDVWVAATDKMTYMVSSEGQQLQYGNHYLRLGLTVSGMAEDGMELERSEIFSTATMNHMPDDTTVMKSAERLVNELNALIHAPLVDPYIGPAILKNRASAVFFHEIFGHRMEGHRQKRETEGQTFTKKVNQPVLPTFLSVYDDPTLANFQGTDLRGYYKFDDEGTPAQRVTLVENGILRNFLMSRSPIENFSMSNGHGRRQYGYSIVSRMGNTIVQSSKTVPYDRLRQMLIDECKKQGKPYGLIFDDIAGGFTMTGRYSPQAFKVLPLLVYRVYADGRPDEVVRGVDIVGTPLTCFSKIVMTADDDGVFNGTCGAESGMVPVSGVSPSILVSEIEVEKRVKEQEKPPILPPPEHDKDVGGIQ